MPVPGAIVVDLQNGVDNPERLRRAGIDPIPAVVYVAAAIEAPGAVKHRGRGDLVIGHPDRPQDVERVAARFGRAGVPCGSRTPSSTSSGSSLSSTRWPTRSAC